MYSRLVVRYILYSFSSLRSVEFSFQMIGSLFNFRFNLS
jgi:hypothetical protein